MSRPHEVPLRFTTITDYSLDLEVWAYVATSDYNEYLKVQSDLLLELLAAIRKHAIKLAIPISGSIDISPQLPNPTAPTDSHPVAEL